MKTLEDYIRLYKGSLEDLFYDIKEENLHLKEQWDNSLIEDLDYASTKREIIERKKSKLTKSQKKQLEELDQKLIQIYDILKGTPYEKIFIQWFSKYFPMPAHT